MGWVPLKKSPEAEVVPVKAPPLPPDLRAALTRHYRDDILRLQGVLGRDLSSWLDGAGR